MVRVKVSSFALGITLLVAAAAPSAAWADDLNDYPTTARVDYVFGCMKANGETQHTLDQCSCSIDVIASILPYLIGLREGLGDKADKMIVAGSKLARIDDADLRDVKRDGDAGHAGGEGEYDE